MIVDYLFQTVVVDTRPSKHTVSNTTKRPPVVTKSTQQRTLKRQNSNSENLAVRNINDCI